MNTNKIADKFSVIEADMIPFVHYLAARNAGDSILMEYDELVGELYLELVKGVQYYADKNLSNDQLKAVLRKILDNRISELRYRYYVTHRAAAMSALSLSDDGCEFISADDPTPDQVYASKELVESVRAALSETAQQVFDAVVLGASDMLGTLVWLSCVRANTVHANSKAVMKYWHVASALGLEENDVRQAFKEIKAVMAYDVPAVVCNQIEYT